MTTRVKHGRCPCCQRVCHLTFHHLIPRKLHRRARFRQHYDKQQLNAGINICRQCHNGIHHHYDEMQLGKSLSTLEALRDDPKLQRYFAWVSQQRIIDPA